MHPFAPAVRLARYFIKAYKYSNYTDSPPYARRWHGECLYAWVDKNTRIHKKRVSSRREDKEQGALFNKKKRTGKWRKLESSVAKRTKALAR
jgi:hypothetical protein